MLNATITHTALGVSCLVACERMYYLPKKAQSPGFKLCKSTDNCVRLYVSYCLPYYSYCLRSCILFSADYQSLGYWLTELLNPSFPRNRESIVSSNKEFQLLTR